MIKKTGFTLVELIVVIAIIAVLGTVAVLGVQSWIGTSRDAARGSNLDQIISALETSMYNSTTLPMPDAYIPITASGTVIGYQGTFCDGAVAGTTMKSTPKDPSDKKCFPYLIDATKTKYQLMALYEKDSSDIAYESGKEQGESKKEYASNVIAMDGNDRGDLIEERIASSQSSSQGQLFNDVYAADTRYPKVKGDKLGILVDTNNIPVNEIATGVDVVNTTSTYKAYFKSDDYVSGTGLTLFTNIYNRNGTLVKNNKDLALYDNSLVGYWDMETMSGTKLKDFSKYHYDGTLNGGVQAGTVSGKIGKASDFNGVDGYLNMGSTSLLNFTTSDFTYSYWVYLDTLVSQVMPLSKGTFQSYGWYVNITTTGITRLLLNVSGSGYTLSSPSSAILVSNWYNVVGVKSGNTGKLYINGVLVGTTTFTASPASSSDDFYVGRYTGSSSGYVDGKIDEVRVYNRALSTTEVQSLYSSVISN